MNDKRQHSRGLPGSYNHWLTRRRLLGYTSHLATVFW